MDAEEFRKAGKQMIDYIADYLENIRERKVLPSVEPNYIRQVVPPDPPEEPEKWDQVFGDIEKVVMSGVTHWHSPHFHAYFPTGNSYPGILGGMLSDALSCIGFTWYSSPACTELEMQMCDWMAKALSLPDFYMFNNATGKPTNGGGVIQGSASDSTFVTLIAAKHLVFEKIRRAILKTVEYRTKEEKRHQERRNQKLKQSFLNFLKDVIKAADQIQENNKFFIQNQLKDETTKLVNSFFNKKDKNPEIVNNKKQNLTSDNDIVGETERLIETKDSANLESKTNKCNLNETDKKYDSNNHKMHNDGGKNNKNNFDNIFSSDAKSNYHNNDTILDLHLQYLVLTDKLFNADTAKMVMYCSSQAHSSVEKAALLSSVIVRKVESTPNQDNDLGLDGFVLEKAILKDLEFGFVPFYVVATLGTTSSLAFDKLNEIGPIAKKYDLWLHIDAAYAGSAFVCPEYRNYLEGIEYTNSFAMNPHKWLLVNFDCSLLWVRDSSILDRAMNVSPAYLKYEKQGQIPDYRHWQIPLGRRFRSLKLWFVMRLYGISGLQKHIRKQINLAIAFSNLIKKDNRFELTHPVIMGLVCFRLKGSNEINERLVQMINNRRNIHIMSTILQEKCIIRFAVCSRYTELHDIETAFIELTTCLDMMQLS